MAVTASVRKPLRQFSRLIRRWSLGSKAETQIATWTAMDESGAALEAVLALPGWGVVEQCKRHYQAEAEARMRTHTLPEPVRFQAAVEWNTLEALFREVRIRIREGQKAREALAKVKEPSKVSP